MHSLRILSTEPCALLCAELCAQRHRGPDGGRNVECRRLAVRFRNHDGPCRHGLHRDLHRRASHQRVRPLVQVVPGRSHGSFVYGAEQGGLLLIVNAHHPRATPHSTPGVGAEQGDFDVDHPTPTPPDRPHPTPTRPLSFGCAVGRTLRTAGTFSTLSSCPSRSWHSGRFRCPSTCSGMNSFDVKRIPYASCKSPQLDAKRCGTCC